MARQHGPLRFALAMFAISSTLPVKAQETPDRLLGMSVKQAIEVCHPAGQRAYLARLVCPGGAHPTFERIGSVGLRNEIPPGTSEDDEMAMVLGALDGASLPPGQVDHHMVDAYRVQCGREKTTTLYLDMYHCAVPAPGRAPPGFTIVE